MDIIKSPENLSTTSSLLILLHGIISLPDAKSFDKNNLERPAMLLCYLLI